MLSTPAISYDQALKEIRRHVRPMPVEQVPFSRTAGRILAEDIRVATDDPPADISAMDGYALREADSAGATESQPLTLRYSETLGAGHAVANRTGRGEAVRIMTGAVIPAGMDAVVKFEDTSGGTAGRFTISRPLRAGENIFRQGKRMKTGDLVLRAGQPVSPQAHGMLATLGRERVLAYRQPRVGLLALGDELVPAGQRLGPGQIHVSNLYALESLLPRYGAIAVHLGILGDDPAAIESALRGPLSTDDPAAACDIVLTLGGSMRGDFDFVSSVIARLGAAGIFEHTRVIPARSTQFAELNGRLIFGLPGSPVASWIAFEMFVLEALWRMAGRRAANHPRFSARLTAPVDSSSGDTHFVPALLEFSDGAQPPSVSPLRIAGDENLPPGLLGNAFIICGQDSARLEPGELVSVTWLDG